MRLLVAVLVLSALACGGEPVVVGPYCALGADQPPQYCCFHPCNYAGYGGGGGSGGTGQ